MWERRRDGDELVVKKEKINRNDDGLLERVFLIIDIRVFWELSSTGTQEKRKSPSRTCVASSQLCLLRTTSLLP